MRGETLRFLSLDELPSEASVDRQSFARYEVRSLVAVPLEVADPDRRTISCLTLRNGKTWPDDVVQRLRTVGEMFAGALARAQAEAALSESEARFRYMANNAPVLIWMSGLDKGCTFFNKGWLDFTGRPMAKELGSGWVDGVHPDDVDRCLETYETAFDLRQPFSMEYRLRRHDGQYRTIVDRGVPRFAPDGTLVGYIGCADDITERKRGEELPRQVLEAAPNAMIMVNQDGRITLVNAAVEMVFGYAREELIGSAIEILVPERVRPHHPGDRAHYFADPSVRMMGAGRELYGRRKDGSAVPVEIGLTPIQTPEGLFVLASVIDITARKAAELEAERHRAELAHVERISTMGQLATSLAHELNQPLTAILANAQTAQEWLARPSPDLAEIRETVDDIIAEDIRASEVIRRMRGLIQKGELRSDAVDLNELARDVTRLAANAALLRGASIECDLSSALPTVRGDVVQFQQVLLNLLVNGLHAVAEQPIPRRRVIVRTAGRDGGVEVSVQDRGKGIAESDLQQVFAPFYSTKGEGLGVGLSISRSIVETYGGRIWAENDPDGGAIFRIRLPAGSTAAETTGPPR
jgi:two-component system sensor kinase FixL